MYVLFFVVVFLFYSGEVWGRESLEMQAMCGFDCAKMVDSKVVLSCLSPTVYKALRYFNMRAMILSGSDLQTSSC